MIAVVRLRWDPATKAYLTRRTKDGLSIREIIRCLKRRLADHVWRLMIADLGQQASSKPRLSST